ncbi:hypothetical protein [Chlorogloeopsis sp. ULAP02]
MVYYKTDLQPHKFTVTESLPTLSYRGAIAHLTIARQVEVTA